MLGVKRKAAEPVTLTPARLALAEAIAERDSALTRHQARQVALTRAAAALNAAREALWTAQGAVNKAPELMREWLIAEATGAKMEKPATIKEARANLEAAEVEHAAALEAHEFLKADLEKFASGPGYYEGRAKGMAVDIVSAAPATAMLISEALDLRRQLNEKAQILAWLDGLKTSSDRTLSSVIYRLNRPISATDAEDNYEDAIRMGKAAPWARSIEALLADAGAKIEIE